MKVKSQKQEKIFATHVTNKGSGAGKYNYLELKRKGQTSQQKYGPKTHLIEEETYF